MCVFCWKTAKLLCLNRINAALDEWHSETWIRKVRAMKKLIIGMLMVGSLSACAGRAAEFADRPSPILCEQAVSLTPFYVYYDELIAELNKRGEDCSEYIGNSETVKTR